MKYDTAEKAWRRCCSLQGNCSYAEENKKEFHSRARCVLRYIREKHLDGDECDIRPCKGGIAVSGEMTLHSDHVYVQMSADTFIGPGNRPCVLVRSCTGRKDYTGGRNQWFPYKKEQFAAFCRFVELVHKTQKNKVNEG